MRARWLLWPFVAVLVVTVNLPLLLLYHTSEALYYVEGWVEGRNATSYREWFQMTMWRD